MNIYIETFGCQMNRLDSELVAGLLRGAGHEVTADRAGADVILYNTCSVRRHAEQKVRSRLGTDAQRKRSTGDGPIIGVLGCMAQRLGEQLAGAGRADIVCAPGQLHRLVELIDQASAGRVVTALDPTRREPADEAGEMEMDRLDLTRLAEPGGMNPQAFVRVARGCDNFCTYCIVPFVRGRLRSRRPDDIVEEVRRLVDAGRSEITLLGQTVNSYRYSDECTTVRFSDLLERVAAVPGLRRLRFVTSHPVDFTDDVLQAMRDLDNVCPYIHCPAQSGSDSVLKRMNRGYGLAQYNDLIDRARQIVPDVVLAGDFIVGFPGETDSDHEASAALIRRSGYKNSFIFKYSSRPGTAAARKLVDDVPTEVKKQRNADLLAVQEEVSLAHHQGQIGRTFEVLVEGPSKRSGKQARPPRPECMQLVGRTRGDHIVIFDGPAELAGQYVDLTITGATPLALLAGAAGC